MAQSVYELLLSGELFLLVIKVSMHSTEVSATLPKLGYQLGQRNSLTAGEHVLQYDSRQGPHPLSLPLVIIISLLASLREEVGSSQQM